MFEDKVSTELSTPCSDVSLDDSSPSTEIIVFCYKSVFMETRAEELEEYCNEEENSMLDLCFEIVFKILIHPPQGPTMKQQVALVHPRKMIRTREYHLITCQIT
jgi:hypothetical protein